MNSQEIKKLREDIQLSQTKFSQLLGVSAATIAFWEKGERNPPQIYQASFMSLRDKLDSSKNKQDTLDTLGKFLLIGGMTAFLTWIFRKD